MIRIKNPKFGVGGWNSLFPGAAVLIEDNAVYLDCTGPAQENKVVEWCENQGCEFDFTSEAQKNFTVHFEWDGKQIKTLKISGPNSLKASGLNKLVEELLLNS